MSCMFESHCGKLRFGTLAIPFTPLCQCLSEDKAMPHVTISSTISSTMDFNVAKIASARASSTKSLTISLRVAGP